MERSRSSIGYFAFAIASALVGRNANAQNEMPTNIAGSSPERDIPPIVVRGWVARPGLQLGVRVADALGAGVIYSGLGVQDASHTAIPIMVDVGFRVIPQIYVGLYGQFAPVIVKNNPQSCPEGFDCAAQDWRFGIQVDYHFLPRTRFDPYVGLGSGYEVLHSSASGSAPVPGPNGAIPGQIDAHAIDRGWEFAALTLGFDYRAADFVGLGPFVAASIGEYNVRTGNQAVSVGGATIANNALNPVSHATHEIFFFGVRGTFNPL